MNSKYVVSLITVIVLFLLAFILVETAAGFQVLFGIIIPYLALVVFFAGFIQRLLGWARVPVPFRIPTTCGQQKTLPWIKSAAIDNPSSNGGVVVRMALEILLFRSLFRNTRMNLEEGSKLTYKMELFLWLAALAFHYSFLVVLVRHMRFFTNPVPGFVQLLEGIDGFFRMEILTDIVQIGVPGVFLSGIVLIAAITFLLLRRIFMAHMKYISLAADYFPLFLIFGIAFTGIMMRYFTKVDVTAAKELAMGLVTFQPGIPEGLGAIFYVHLFFVCVLLAYFPYSKLMHLGGVFLSPTRNLSTDTRARRHVNPWNYPVPVHTYDEYEEEFREKMIEAGLPVEKE